MSDGLQQHLSQNFGLQHICCICSLAELELQSPFGIWQRRSVNHSLTAQFCVRLRSDGRLCCTTFLDSVRLIWIVPSSRVQRQDCTAASPCIHVANAQQLNGLEIKTGHISEAEEQKTSYKTGAHVEFHAASIDIYQNCTQTFSKLYANMGYAPAEAKLHKLTQNKKIIYIDRS